VTKGCKPICCFHLYISLSLQASQYWAFWNSWNFAVLKFPEILWLVLKIVVLEFQVKSWLHSR
jgi:hypothetical protein